MNKKQLIIITILLILISSRAYAYFEDYPPYKFKDGPPKHLEAQELVGSEKSEYKSDDGQVHVRLEGTNDTIDFVIQDGKTIVTSLKERESPMPCVVYWTDLDKNGLKDFIVFNWYEGCGLASQEYRIDIFLKKADGSYQRISYDTMGPDLEDFVDLNKDGKYEVIITDTYGGEKHNYFVFNLSNKSGGITNTSNFGSLRLDIA